MFGFDCRGLVDPRCNVDPETGFCAQLAPSAAGALGGKLLGAAGGGSWSFLQKRRRGSGYASNSKI